MSRLVSLLFGVLIALPVCTQAADAIDQLLTGKTAPPGVVFDVDEWDHDALQWAVPLIRAYVDRLRARFPALEIAVVSHGEEEFALMKQARRQFGSVQQGIEELVKDKVTVHVCAGHAVMSGYSENDFVGFVDRVSAGVEAVAEYRRRGFIYIPIEQPR